VFGCIPLPLCLSVFGSKPAMKEITIFPIDRLELVFAQKGWTFAEQRRIDIDVYFDELRRKKPTIWNGRVLLLHNYAMNENVFRGAYLETDFASFTAWRHWGHPYASVHDCFGAAAILSADGAFLLGVMGPHTANAGSIYFPCGTPDLNDILAGKVDLHLSVARELKEETGCDISEFTADPGWATVIDDPCIMHAKLLHSSEKAETLRARMLGHLKWEEQPELSDIRIVRGVADISPAMPRFVITYLRHYFARMS
jgi:8-oxo-dGTP pyrophosphatase MutT (NUDIX family)